MNYSFRNHHRSHIRESQNDFNKSHKWKRKEARAFVEILVYIENSVEEGEFFFKLSELRFLYESRLKDWERSTSKATSSRSLLIVLALFMSQSKRTISHSLRILNLSKKQSNHRLLKA